MRVCMYIRVCVCIYMPQRVFIHTCKCINNEVNNMYD